MESTNNKIVTVSLMIIAVIMGIVVNVFIETMAAMATGGFSRFLANDIVKHGLPVAFGIILFAVLQFNKTVSTFADEVVVEIRRVVWPSRKDTMSMTTVVCIMLVISGIALGVLDTTSAYVVDWLLHINFGSIFS